MKWDEVPDGTAMSITKEGAMAMRRGGTKTFLTGAACGAIALFALQSCASDHPADASHPATSVSSTAAPHTTKH